MTEGRAIRYANYCSRASKIAFPQAIMDQSFLFAFATTMSNHHFFAAFFPDHANLHINCRSCVAARSIQIMARQHLHKLPTDGCIQSITSSILIALLVSQLATVRYAVSAMTPANGPVKTDTFGAFMERQPESTIAPLYDEVVFECALNLDPDRIEWRFHPQKSRNANAKAFNDYVYLNQTVCASNITRKSTCTILRQYFQ